MKHLRKKREIERVLSPAFFFFFFIGERSCNRVVRHIDGNAWIFDDSGFAFL